MTVLQETIWVNRPIKEVFAYIADFTTTQEWDSTAISAEKVTAGPIGLETQFSVRCALPMGSIDISYTVNRYEKNQRIDLAGKCRFFDIQDSITFEPENHGTRINYRAEFSFGSVLSPLVSAFQSGLHRMGRTSMEGMQAALADNVAAPKASAGTRLADKLVLPGLTDFTRWGYSRSRKRWQPMSAYMGDKHIVITGATNGLGYSAAMELARRGAKITLVVRNAKKAEEVVAEITAATGNSKINTVIADLSLLSEVDKVIRELNKGKNTIDVLINNAGALFNDYSNTTEGIEKSLALLLLSPYRLTLGLKPALCRSVDPRVINVVSGGMYTQRLDMETLLHKPGQNYSGPVAYARAKRALMVVTKYWSKEWEDEGIIVNAMHPGWANTPGVQDAMPEFYRVTRSVLRTPEEGADTMVWLAVATEAAKISGELLLDRVPHTPYLLPGTRESIQETMDLLAFLEHYDAATALAA